MGLPLPSMDMTPLVMWIAFHYTLHDGQHIYCRQPGKIYTSFHKNSPSPLKMENVVEIFDETHTVGRRRKVNKICWCCSNESPDWWRGRLGVVFLLPAASPSSGPLRLSTDPPYLPLW